jgi:hypothetical protein
MFFISTSGCAAQASQQRYLFPLSKNNHTLTVVNLATLNVIALMPVGKIPHEVIAPADDKRAYESNYGGGILHEIDVFDVVTNKALTHVDTRLFLDPHGLTFVAEKLWFTPEGSKSVDRFDLVSNFLDWATGTG